MEGNTALSGKVVFVASGEAHSLILTGDGRVYSWGRGMFGRLGTGSEVDELFPIQVKFETCEEKKTQLRGGCCWCLS
ncbi:hypothetical protein OIU84_000337 [Salix udensis]|uniref:Uncharacterized protein n=1 Tax=Salix udensis TaxID=889485 RepID=A0AAD6L4E5_9ROSI|nr:hypothetical protein OIU84_000337 [Salix udensis]